MNGGHQWLPGVSGTGFTNCERDYERDLHDNESAGEVQRAETSDASGRV